MLNMGNNICHNIGSISAIIYWYNIWHSICGITNILAITSATVQNLGKITSYNIYHNTLA